MPQPVHSAGTDPSFAGAIMALLHSLVGAAAPKSVMDRQTNINAAVEGQPNPMQQPQAQPVMSSATLLPQGLGQQFYQNADR